MNRVEVDERPPSWLGPAGDRVRGVPSKLRIALAIVVVGAAVVAILSPTAVGEALGRVATTAPEKINLRASWGGTLLGIGAAIGLAQTATRGRLILSSVMWVVAGIGIARALGFVLDGGPDVLQWVWLVAEIAIVAVCLWWLRRPIVAP
jgi:hypothetical protein